MESKPQLERTVHSQRTAVKKRAHVILETEGERDLSLCKVVKVVDWNKAFYLVQLLLLLVVAPYLVGLKSTSRVESDYDFSELLSITILSGSIQSNHRRDLP